MSDVAAVLVAALAAGAGTAAVAWASLVGLRRRNQVVPGHAGPAPVSWAGAHTPEARLHRRLRDAMAAARALPDLGGTDAGTWAELDRYALALDARLVAIARLPGHVQGPPLARVGADIEALEDAIGALTAQVTATGSRPDEAIRAFSERAAQLDEARAEIDAIEAGGPLPPQPEP